MYSIGAPGTVIDRGHGCFHPRVNPSTRSRAGADRGADRAVSVERQVRAQHDLGVPRVSPGLVQLLDRGERVGDQALAPRGEPHDSLRSRCATITGAAASLVTVASRAFRPRTAEYP